MDTARNHILQKYHVSPDARLSGGMEADVYVYRPDAVLKLYAGTASLADLCILRDFYDTLDRQYVPYALPRIHTVAQEGRFCITVEQRLAGTRLSAVLPALMADQLDVIMQRYLAMLLDRLGEHVRGRIYRYVLIYSILSANTYSPNCTDGHYRWCIANLSDQHYWNAIE